jgi:DNA-directed RNA polymerase specialized sigma24 family protein
MPGVRDKQEFRAIYEAHHASVCAYFARRAARDDVEDLAAETFAVAWRKLPRRLEHPLPWLYAVAGKVLSNHRRKVARRGEFAADPASGDPAERLRDAERARPRGDLPGRLGRPLDRRRRPRRGLQHRDVPRPRVTGASSSEPSARQPARNDLRDPGEDLT